MKVAAAVLCLLFASCAAAPSAVYAPLGPEVRADGSSPSQLALYVGQRALDEDDYEPVEDQLTIGVEYSREHAEDPVGWEVGLMASGDESVVGGNEVEGSTTELYAGIRKSFALQTVQPYVGVGFSLINSTVEVAGSGDDDDNGFGLYAHGGATVQVSDAVRVGLDLRGLFLTDLEIDDQDADADYVQLAVFIAFGF